MLCYICREESTNLIRPCKCKWVHRACLNRWRTSSIDRHDRCEVCGHLYKLVTWQLLSVAIFLAIGMVLVGYGIGYVSALWVNFYQNNSTDPKVYQAIFHGVLWCSLPGLAILFLNDRIPIRIITVGGDHNFVPIILLFFGLLQTYYTVWQLFGFDLNL